MDHRSRSLLERLHDRADAQAWQRLVSIYEPWLRGWLSRHALQPADVEDILQDVLVVLSAKLTELQHNSQRGAFRAWPRTILTHRVLHFLRGQRRHNAMLAPMPAASIEELPDPDSAASKQWDVEHDQHVVRRMRATIQPEFSATTWRVFEMLVLENRRAAEVAQHLGISTTSVYVAKARVLSRLRAELRGLMNFVPRRYLPRACGLLLIADRPAPCYLVLSFNRGGRKNHE
jgi:RNA polymerase sigma-70 factor, ECF subfamily